MADASQYRMNPQVGKMMSGQRPDAGVKKPDPGMQEEKDNRHPDHVELHGHEPGPFKTMHHHGVMGFVQGIVGPFFRRFAVAMVVHGFEWPRFMAVQFDVVGMAVVFLFLQAGIGLLHPSVGALAGHHFPDLRIHLVLTGIGHGLCS